MDDSSCWSSNESENKIEEKAGETENELGRDDAGVNFFVQNPLVLIICCSKYQGWDDLPGVEEDDAISNNLFRTFYGWKVKRIQNGSKSQILDFMDHHRASIVKKKNHQCEFPPF